MPNTKTYNPKEVSVIVGGHIVNSWNTATIAREEDGFFFATGTTGESSRAKNANKMGTLTIVLPQTSVDNDALSALELSGALVPCSIIDKSGTTLAVMPQGTVLKQADAELGKELGEREWIIKGDIDVLNVGGNN